MAEKEKMVVIIAPARDFMGKRVAHPVEPEKFNAGKLSLIFFQGRSAPIPESHAKAFVAHFPAYKIADAGDAVPDPEVQKPDMTPAMGEQGKPSESPKGKGKDKKEK